MNRNYPHFAIPEIYGETLSYYELLRKLVKAMNVMIENYNTIPDQIAEAVANLDASQLFSAVLNQLIHSIATDNTRATNAVKVYKKHDLLYATFNETVNLYESLIDFTEGTETELIPGTNIREVNISELFIELRKLIDINKNNIEAVTAVANENSAEIATMHNDITGIENKNTEQDNEISTLRTMISSPYNFKGDVASISALPASGVVNDTYYVREVKYKVTWTGSAWVQSSLNESDYQTELGELKGDLDKLDKEVSNDYKNIIGEYPLIEIARATTTPTGILYNTNTGEVFTGEKKGNAISVDIPAYAKYLVIDAYSIQTPYGFYCILDSSNNVIKSEVADGTYVIKKYMIVTIPSGSSKICVNSTYYNTDSVIPVVRAAKDLPNKKLICNYDNLRSGYDNSGKITNDADYMCTSNLINVSNMNYVTIYTKTNRTQDGFHAIYSDMNTFVDVVPWETFPSESNITIDTSNINYIRLSFNKYKDVEYVSDTIKIVGYLNKPITNNVIKNYQLPVNTTNTGYVGTSDNAQYNTISSAYVALGRSNCSLIIEPNIYSGRFNAENFRLFGLSESNCIMIYQNGYYPYAVLEPQGNIYCENLTFVTYNDTTKTRHAYAMHVEAIDNLKNVDKTMIFKHCTFVSDLAPAIGVGMSKGLQMFFEDCTFYSQSESAIFFHDSVYSEALGEQFISFKDCKFISASDCSIKIQSVNENNMLTCEFINCTSTALYGANNSLKIFSPASEGFLCGNSVKLSKSSHGNNIDMLNAIDD